MGLTAHAIYDLAVDDGSDPDDKHWNRCSATQASMSFALALIDSSQ